MIEFTTDWYQQDNLDKLQELARSAKGSGSYIEVGCWEGRSSITLANVIYPHKLICIDTWEGSIPDGYSVRDNSVYDRFVNNMHEGTKGNFVINRTRWEEYKWDKLESIRFIHIDAEHTYKAVKENIEVVLPKMTSGGVICGDDYYHEPVREAVLNTLPNATALSAALWTWTAP